ncbi:potassium-transporting ATPase subunit KdpB [Myceligenerans pegani]|uniref:Potassium-transporting ATPase ATP-binding subunit n=1 Tax=Myceligenerans pegani TaxID=2776917 RepID=A0ABR9MW99_9MICO|nr:HAD-IC family P-type ATPase [Myceligenerans sp. TRM 65318]MBE1875675.1 potassium-transporting ATPase subunit KdpB [Myceligenerans sp. TRM 65318]MBE3017946.1 potassium-transporting ATPase subunit KdpB [Myceligenerans sp. TRM 65318]
MSTPTQNESTIAARPEVPGPEHFPHRHTRPARALTWSQVREAVPAALRKLDPRDLWHSPVMFVVEVGALVTTVLAIVQPAVFAWWIAGWLWATVVFATLAEAIAESRGKAQASTLRATQQQTTAHRIVASPMTPESAATFDGVETVEVPSATLRVGDVVVVTAGQAIPGDGDVIDGVASVDESAITGESAPVIRESGGDRSAVTGGTRVLSDRIVVRITAPAGQTFVDRMIALVEGSERQRTPNEIALNILLTSLTIVFLLAVATLQPFAVYSGARQSLLVLVALLVCLIPTTIGALLSAIGIAGMDRLVQRNVLAMSGRAVEAAGDVDVLLLDKTGTITYGNRRATEVLPLGSIGPRELADAARLASLADATPEGRSIVELVDTRYAPDGGAGAGRLAGAELVPFTAQTRMSGVDLPVPSGADGGVGRLPRDGAPSADGIPGNHEPSSGTVRRIRKGAGSAIQRWVLSTGTALSDAEKAELTEHIDAVSRPGGTPLVVAEQTGDRPARILGVVRLKDVVKNGMRERFDELRAMGIRSVMVTGDNAVTARAIAAEAGVDDVLAEATPEDKLALIRREQEGGRLVAMAGDGTNDAPALAQSDVGVAMNTGTTAAKEAGNMVDLDSDPTKLIEIVEIGKQLLITRGALTTFSVANDVAKYFAILPAMFVGVFPQLDVLNIMRLSSPESAILSAVIFNALIILVLVPLALHGVRYRPASASALLRRNLLIYGLGGLIAPFAGIKLIDLVVSLLV